jgi:4-alpha-glucanotransferase
MRDAAVYDLARRAGIAVDWRDYANQPHRVSVETLRHVLAALALPCETDEDLAHSRRSLDERAPPPLITATVGEPVPLPVEGGAPPRLRIEYQDESIADLTVEQTADGVVLPSIDKVGCHHVEVGPRRLTLAVAPARCVTVSDIAPGERIWGLAAQIYGLHSPGDCGIGDMAGAVALGKTAARLKAAALALSPTTHYLGLIPTTSVLIRHQVGCFTILSTRMRRRCLVRGRLRKREAKRRAAKRAYSKTRPSSIGADRVA